MELNHTIVWSNDPARSAAFVADVLGRPEPRHFLHFHVVDMDNGVSLDFMQQDGTTAAQHYAFLVSEAEFEAAFSRIRERKLQHWADPARTKPNEINRHFGGRGVYFPDPDGHILEIITRPYGRESEL